MRLYHSLIAACVLALAGCGDAKPPESTAQNGIKVVADKNAPLGQLPDDVTPLHYRIALTLRPNQPDYEGVVEVDLELKAPKQTIYLHGRDLQIDDANARLADGAMVAVSYAQVHESGVARLSFDKEVPAGKITVRLPRLE